MEEQKAGNSLIQEIKKKIRLSITLMAFVIATLSALLFYHLYLPAAVALDFLPHSSIAFIIGLAFSLALVGIYLANLISRQVLRIIGDYSRRLEKILNITRDMREELYGDILLEKIMEYALSITKSDAGSILLLDNDKFVFKVVKGEKAEKLLGSSVEKGKGISGWVAETGKSLRISDVSKDSRFNPEIDTMTGYATTSILCVPMKIKSEIIGVIELLNRNDGQTYRDRDEEIITYLAEQAAISIMKTKFYEDQKNFEIHLTEMLLEAIDFHIPEKTGHSRRVARYSNLIAKGMGMSEEEKKKLHFACLLHDIGFLKISPDDVYKKEHYIKHPVIGYEMIKPITFYAAIAPVILHHHERYDGYGYPSGLKGEDIPLEARIIAIAEAFDAMISSPSYRVPVNFNEALEELKRKGGSQFDMELVDLFTSNINSQYIKP